MTEQEYLDSKNIVTEYVDGFTDRNGWENTSLTTLLKDFKEQLILSGVSNHVVCDECGNTGRGRPTLQEPDGVDCEKCSSK